MNVKFFKDLWRDDQVKSVSKEIDDSWRHRNHVSEVFKDEAMRYWRVDYRVSGDGEYHGIRDEEFTITQVSPVTKTVVVTEYVEIDHD
jgi:hypothetical protein